MSEYSDNLTVADVEAITPAPQPEGEPVTLTYTNWRGETAQRTLTPKRIWWGATDWHPEPQWLLTAFDAEKQAERDFALKGFGAADEIDRLRAEIGRLKREVGVAASAMVRNHNRAEKAEAEIARLTKERDTDHANINLKADFIEATINQLALAEAERDEARAQVAAAYGSAADALQNLAENWDCGHNESRLCDCARDVEQWGLAADEVRSMAPTDYKSALEAYGREKVREGMQRVIDRLRHEGQINPSLTYADAIEWAENILADMEKLK